MTEQEQQPQQKKQEKRFAPNPVIGAVPALVGVVIVLIHLRRPLVIPEDQSLLTNSCLGLLCISLGMWMFWGLELVVERVCGRFDERHNHLEALANDNMRTLTLGLERLSESLTAARRKLARLYKLVEDAERRLAGTETQLKAAEARLAIVEQQGVALGAVFIEEGVPRDAWRN